MYDWLSFRILYKLHVFRKCLVSFIHMQCDGRVCCLDKCLKKECVKLLRQASGDAVEEEKSSEQPPDTAIAADEDRNAATKG